MYFETHWSLLWFTKAHYWSVIPCRLICLLGCTLEQRCLLFSVWRFADIILMLWLTDTEVPVQSEKIELLLKLLYRCVLNYWFLGSTRWNNLKSSVTKAMSVPSLPECTFFLKNATICMYADPGKEIMCLISTAHEGCSVPLNWHEIFILSVLFPTTFRFQVEWPGSLHSVHA